MALLHRHTYHRGSNRARFASSLLSADLGDGGLTVINDDDSGLGVDLEEALSSTSVLVELSNGEESDDQKLSGFNLDVDLLIDLRFS